MPLIRSISGLRATLSDGLFPTVISDYVAAFAKLQPYGEIVLGRDGRPSGRWIGDIVKGTLVACGKQVRDIGIVPTPTVQLEVEHSNAVGGIAITASHNPGEWNGLKFLDETGVFLDKSQNEKLWNILENKSFDFSDEFKNIEVKIDNIAIDNHINSVLNIPLIDEKMLKEIKNKKLKVVVDAVNASGSLAIPALLEKFGIEVVHLYCDQSGIFPHTPEPLPINLTELANNVKLHNADLGIAVDPDADRLVLIDETGEPIGEEKTIVLSALAVFENFDKFKNYDKKAVVNLSTSRMIEDIAKEYGFEIIRSAVGEINVVNKMKEVNAIIGGEGSGGVILPSCHYGRDSLVGTALILFLMVSNDKKLSELSENLPNYKMLKLKKEYAGNLSDIFGEIESKFNGNMPSKIDGLRYDFEESWVQARPSNTEPIIRVIAEAKSEENAENIAYEILKMF